jgi:hypothetical protein
MFFFTESTLRQKVSGSISAKTGIPPYISGVTHVADMVSGGTMTSSPGLKPMAPKATCIPEVAEFTDTEYFTLNFLDHSSSNFKISVPLKY